MLTQIVIVGWIISGMISACCGAYVEGAIGRPQSSYWFDCWRVAAGPISMIGSICALFHVLGLQSRR